MDTNLVEIFYIIDEFCKEFEKAMEGHLIAMDISKKGCDCKLMLLSISIYLIPKLFPDTITFIETS